MKIKAWELMYGSEELNDGKKLAGNVEIIKNDGVEIIAEIETCTVKTYIQFNSPTYASCSCAKQRPCKHQTALIYYLESHPELFMDEMGLEEILSNVSEDNLKEFLLKELKTNVELESKFLKEFETSSIDQKYYEDKLSRILERRKDEYFDDHGIYDLNPMASDLYGFLMGDIDTIMSAGEYDFACGLLCRIGKVLNDEIVSTSDSWYDLTDLFMEKVDILSTSIHLDADKMSELHSHIGHIISIL